MQYLPQTQNDLASVYHTFIAITHFICQAHPYGATVSIMHSCTAFIPFCTAFVYSA